jgi:hypothetical protein
MKRIITLISIAAGLVLVGPAGASASCRGIMTTPGYHDSYTSSIDVEVSRYLGMTCSRALRIGAAAYLEPGLRPIYGPQFGGGGFGGPFHVGHLYCWLNTRGSDFTVAACWHGQGRQREYVKFYDQRNY